MPAGAAMAFCLRLTDAREALPEMRMPDHGHHHGHSHDHAPPQHLAGTLGMAFLLGIGLNLGFVVIEVVYGWLSHSVALVSDAAHNLGDVLGLGLAWGATVLARRAPSPRRTYGMRRSTILAALANAVVLLAVIGGVAWEALIRLRSAPAVDGWTVVVVAAIGVAVNGASAWLFSRQKPDLNVRAAFLHLLADALVSLGVVASGALTLATGWRWVDPVTSLAVSVAVLWTAWDLLRRSLDLALDAVPDHIDPAAVRTWLATRPGVQSVHDLHIWGMSTTHTALTAHLVMATGGDHTRMVCDLAGHLQQAFGIDHPTIQIEPGEDDLPCRLAPDDVV
jgi:cobalt-zinc-cadmium efflux system protein